MSTSFAICESDSAAKAGRTVHVAGVYDGRFVKLFVDGQLQKRFRWVLGNHIASLLDFMIGADPREPGVPEKLFDGTIDEVRISKVARYSEDFTPPTHEFEPDEDTIGSVSLQRRPRRRRA